MKIKESLFQVCHRADVLRFSVADKDHAYSEKIGEVRLQTAVLLTGDVIEGWFPISGKNGKTDGNGELCLNVRYVPVQAQQKSFDVSNFSQDFIQLFSDP